MQSTRARARTKFIFHMAGNYRRNGVSSRIRIHTHGHNEGGVFFLKEGPARGRSRGEGGGEREREGGREREREGEGGGERERGAEGEVVREEPAEKWSCLGRQFAEASFVLRYIRQDRRCRSARAEYR